MTHLVPVKSASPGFQAVRAPRPVKLPATLARLLHGPAKVAGRSVAIKYVQASLFTHKAALRAKPSHTGQPRVACLP